MAKLTIPSGHVAYDDDGKAHYQGETLNVSAAHAKELAQLWAGPASREGGR